MTNARAVVLAALLVVFCWLVAAALLAGWVP